MFSRFFKRPENRPLRQAPCLFLIAYDVASPRRWRRVNRLMQAVGERVQLSVFLCRMTPAMKAQVLQALSAVIDPAADRLVCINLGQAAMAAVRVHCLGNPLAPMAAADQDDERQPMVA